MPEVRSRLRQKWSRGQVEARLADAAVLDRHVGMRWCVRDAEAIAEAVQRPTMKFV
jgi:hypothetical protein